MGRSWRRPRYLVRPFLAMGVPCPPHSRACKIGPPCARGFSSPRREGCSFFSAGVSKVDDGGHGDEKALKKARSGQAMNPATRRGTPLRLRQTPHALRCLLQRARRSHRRLSCTKTWKGDRIMAHRCRARAALTADVSTRDCRPEAADVPERRRCSTTDHDPWALIVRLLRGGHAGMYLCATRHRGHTPVSGLCT